MTSEQSEMSLGKPSTPKALSTTVDAVELTWGKVQKCDHYQISYKILNENPPKWRTFPKEFEENIGKLNDLKPDTTYVFRVRAIGGDDEGPNSDHSDKIKTSASATANIRFDRVLDEAKRPCIRVLHCEELKKSRNETARTKKVEIGCRPKGTNQNHEKTILLVGETGTGKSTMIDGIANYVLGVRWEDPFRFTIVQLEDDEKKKLKNQALSQTDWITCYIIYPAAGGRIGYTLNIIDTPGFGDTRGLKRDKELVDQMHKLFSASNEKGVLGIDAVCFMIKAPDARLTPTQRYIFESIMALFGHDIKNNICTLLTFADGRTAPALSSLEASGLPFGKISFTFNNSGLFAENSQVDRSGIQAMFWDMGITGFRLFFDHLSKLQTTSLEMTRKVLDERQRLEITVDNLLPMIEIGLEELNKQRNEIKMLKENEVTIATHKNYEYDSYDLITNYRDLPHDHYVTNCRTCKFTCHEHCYIRYDADKSGCWAMDSNGNCRQCPKNCYWNNHQNTPYMFFVERLTVKKTFNDVKANFEKALGKTLSNKEVIEQLDKKLEKLGQDIEQLLTTVNTCNNELQRIALRPNSMTIVEHIQLMIQSEMKEMKFGYTERVQELERYKDKIQYGNKLETFKAETAEVEKAKTSASSSLKSMMSTITVTIETKFKTLLN